MSEELDFHEDLRRGGRVKTSSDRAFGILFAVVFAIVAAWPLFGGGALHLWAAIVAILFALAAVVRPSLLAPLNRIWLKFGDLLHRIVSPLVMAFLYYLTVTPTALIMRILGKVPLELRFDREAASYWVERRPPGPKPETMTQQF